VHYNATGASANILEQPMKGSYRQGFGRTDFWIVQDQHVLQSNLQLEQQVQLVWVSNWSKCKQFEATDEEKLHVWSSR